LPRPKTHFGLAHGEDCLMEVAETAGGRQLDLVQTGWAVDLVASATAPHGATLGRSHQMRTVYATVLEVQDEKDIFATLDYVGKWISDWYRRQRVSVDDVLAAIASSDIETHPVDGHTLAIKHHSAGEFKGENLIDLTWSYPDQYDKSLGWSTRLSLLRRPSGLLVSLELAVTGLSFRVAPASIKLGSPRVVRDVGRLRSVLLGGQSYNVLPELVSADLVEGLASELADPARSYAVVMVSRRTRDDAALVDTGWLADSLAGVAKVYELADKWTAFSFTEHVGKSLSCFDGAMRIYWPRFSLQSDPFAHPLWAPWALADDGSAERSMRQVARTVFDAATFRHVEPAALVAVRRAAEREARQSMRTTAVESADTDKLLEDLYRLEDKLREEEAKSQELATECETLRANAMALASSASWAQGFDPSPAAGSPPPTQATPPASTVLDAVQAAAAASKHLTFLQSAYDSAADSPFRQPDRVREALEAIDEVASSWAESLTSGRSVGSLRDVFKRKYGFAYSDDVSQTSKGKWASQYKASHGGKDYDISPHITIGAKQADTCISIHWAWDEEQKKALVAHVGRHKTNTKT
jgi:hypothetical protein